MNNPFSTVNFTELSLDAARITTASRLEGNLNLKTADRIMTWAEHNKAVGMFDNVRVSVAFFPVTFSICSRLFNSVSFARRFGLTTKDGLHRFPT